MPPPVPFAKDALGSLAKGRKSNYLFLSLPRGMTAVIGAMGRSDVEFLGSDVSFLGFFAIFSLRWSPLAISPP